MNEEILPKTSSILTPENDCVISVETGFPVTDEIPIEGYPVLEDLEKLEKFMLALIDVHLPYLRTTVGVELLMDVKSFVLNKFYSIEQKTNEHRIIKLRESLK